MLAPGLGGGGTAGVVGRGRGAETAVSPPWREGGPLQRGRGGAVEVQLEGAALQQPSPPLLSMAVTISTAITT